MASTDDLVAAKRKVSAVVLKVPGVAGVGLPKQGITVYLEADSPELRSHLALLIDRLDLTVPVSFEVSGKPRRF